MAIFRRIVLSTTAAVLLLAWAGCGAQERADEPATEAETVSAAGFDWFVPLFRELNPHVSPDDDILGSRRPRDGHAFWGAVLNVCNVSAGARRPPEGFRLVDAFGQTWRPVDLPARNPFAYEPVRLPAGECLPRPGSVADRAADGVMLVFEVPFDALDDRPLFLRLPTATAEGDGSVPRVKLDV